MKRSIVVFSAVALLSLLFAACGGSSSTATPTERPAIAGGSHTATPTPATQSAGPTTTTRSGGGTVADACTLIPDSAITSLLSGAVGAGSPTINDNYHDCTWTGEGVVYTVNISVLAHSPGAGIAFNQNTVGVNETGVGDKAKWNVGTKQLDVLAGDSEVLVTVFGANISGDQQISDAKQLAQTIIDNLP